MNKNKIIMSAIGGGALVVSLALGWFLWSASEERAEMADELDGAKGNVERINGAKIAPLQASVDAIDANRKALVEWREDVLRTASVGDAAPDGSMTPEAFKRVMVEGARELAKLPGLPGKPIVKEEFGFGFKDYILGGSMPSREKLAAMQRQWSEVTLFTRTLSEAGAAELVDVTVVEAAAEEAEAAPQPSRPAQRRRAKDKDEEKKAAAVSAQSYVVKFLARPAAIANVFNALATAERFIAVDDFSFLHETDTLASAVGTKDKDGQKRSARSGRRGRRDEQQPEEEEVAKKGLVTDPLIDAPFTVTLKLTTYDFGTDDGSAAKAARAAAAGEEPAASAEAAEKPAEKDTTKEDEE